MSVIFQLKTFATVCSVSGFLLLTVPSVILNTPLEPTLLRLTGLPSTNADPTTLAPAGIAISAIGYMYWMALYSGDDKFVRFSVPGRLLFSAIDAYIMLFTDRGSTGLLTMFFVDVSFAIWLGLSIGFGGVERGMLKDLTKMN